MNATTKRQATRIARTLREEFRSEGEFSQSDYRQALASRLECLRSHAFEGFVDVIAEAVDRDRPAPQVDHRQPHLPGFDLEGEYRLGNDRRIAKRLAQIEHAERAMTIDDVNLMAVQEANIRKRKELVLLRPYWGEGRTKEEAVAAWRAVNPDPEVLDECPT